MPNLVDYSQTIVAASLAFSADFQKGQPVKKMEDVARHVVLNMLQSYNKHYRKYGEVILCADGNKNWRRGVFPQYKAMRAVGKEESGTDWSNLFAIGSQLLEEIRETFPFRVVREPTAEGDDVIAVLVDYFAENELIQEGLEESPQKCFVISSDGDFKQLYRKHKHFAQFNQIQKKLVAKPDKTFILEKVLVGDKGDGVPNVRMGDTTFIDGTRQKPISEKMKQAFYDNPTGSHLTEEEQRNLHRNRLLIDFEYIPSDVADKILNIYKASTFVRDKNAVFNYFTKHRCRQLTEHLDSFF
jgi:5'-3' exonuclease